MDDVRLIVDTKELDKLLAELPRKIVREKLGKALQAGGEVLRDAMEQLAPERTDEPTPGSSGLAPGILKSDIQTDVRIGRESGGTVRVGPGDVAGHVGKWINNGWTLVRGGRHYVAVGHSWKAKRRGSGRVVKEIPGTFFMQGAFDEAGETAANMFAAVLSDCFFDDNTDEGAYPEGDSHDVEMG